jgi:hypothetical protein
MAKPLKKIIHVNQHNIKKNVRADNIGKPHLPVLTCKTYKDNQYGHEILIKDSQGNEVGKFIYSPHKPLSCGARVWFETHLDVEVVENAN